MQMPNANNLLARRPILRFSKIKFPANNTHAVGMNNVTYSHHLASA